MYHSNTTTRRGLLPTLGIILITFFHAGMLHAQIETNITASDTAEFSEFGYSVSVSGDYAIVGARYDNDKGTNEGIEPGSAYIFHYDGSTRREQQKLTANDGAQLDGFGTSVFISGGYAIVGAPGDDVHGNQSGSAYIFHYNDSC